MIGILACAAAAGLGWEDLGAPAETSILAMTAPTAIVSPSATRILMIPASCAARGNDALSESISTTSWSLSTSSPSATNHFATCTCVIDSPGLGTMISDAIFFYCIRLLYLVRTSISEQCNLQ